MRAVIAVATLLVLIWAVTPSTPPLVATPVVAEGIREQRQDEHTFALRWRPVADMPPTVVKEVHHLVLVASDEVVSAVSGVAESPQQGNAATSRHRTRRVSLRTDVCARHGMRKVTVGKRWRCRR